MLAGHSSTRSAGGASVGGTVSSTKTSLVHELGQLLLMTLRERVKFWPQELPALTETVWALVAPEMEPLPEIDHEYEFIPDGARNWVLDFGQTWGAPVIEQVGRGETLRMTSLVSV